MKALFVVILSVVVTCIVSAFSSNPTSKTDRMEPFRKCATSMARFMPDKIEQIRSINGLFQISLANFLNSSSQSLLKEVKEKQMEDACWFTGVMEFCLTETIADTSNSSYGDLKATITKLNNMTCNSNFRKSVVCMINVEMHQSKPCNEKCRRYIEDLRAVMNQNITTAMDNKEVWKNTCKLTNCRTECLKSTIVERCGKIMDFVTKSYRLALEISSLETTDPIESIDECSKEKLFAGISDSRIKRL